MRLTNNELFLFLEEKQEQYNNRSFIESDPISIPHQFSLKEDIEIAGFLVATIAWGQRTTIIKNGTKLMQLMGNKPHEFVLNFTENKGAYKLFKGFVHRTFNGDDLIYFFLALQHIYSHKNGLEALFSASVQKEDCDLKSGIVHFRDVFFELPHPLRSLKHVSNPEANSATKRINMFLRWMVRKDKKGVDFGIWSKIPMNLLSCPLDVHSGNVARKLGILQRTQNDWKATVELTNQLKRFDSNDPVKYDFALFGLGIFEGF